MNLLPAVLISYAQLGPVVQEQLATAGVTPHHSRVEQGSQPSAVLVVGGAPKIHVPSLQGPCDRSLKSEVPCGSCLNWR